MKRMLIFALSASGLLSLPTEAAVPLLTVDGMEGVHIGMTVKQAETVTGPLDVYYSEGPDSCGQAVPKKPWIAGVRFMIENRRIVRIDIAQDKPPAPRAITSSDAGIQIGSTIAAVKRAYGNRLKIEQHPYDGDEGRRLVVRGRKPGREILFETYRGRVTTFRAGLSRPVEYDEGCA